MADVYEDLRPLLFSIAYRMLGSVAEAEDIVQDAFLRYHRAAYLSAVTTRLAIDHLRSARARKESHMPPRKALEEEVARLSSILDRALATAIGLA